MSTNPFPGLPLFDSAKFFNQIPRNAAFPDQSPAVEEFVLGLNIEGVLDDYRYTKDFLTSYSKKSQDTYDKFRGDAERLLLWSWLIKHRSIVELRRRDLEEYTDFVAKPDLSWQADNTERRFLTINGMREPNRTLAPFSCCWRR